MKGGSNLSWLDNGVCSTPTPSLDNPLFMRIEGKPFKKSAKLSASANFFFQVTFERRWKRVDCLILDLFLLEWDSWLLGLETNFHYKLISLLKRVFFIHFIWIEHTFNKIDWNPFIIQSVFIFTYDRVWVMVLSVEVARFHKHKLDIFLELYKQID